MKKGIIFFTDKHSRIITDSYNLDMAILNSFRDVSEFNNTAIIMDTNIINIISNDYILGGNRLGIFVSEDYNDNWDFCVNIKDNRQMCKFIDDHPSILYLYVYSEESPRYIHEMFLDGESEVYEIKCDWLEVKESPCYIMEVSDLKFSGKKPYPLFILRRYVPDYVRKEIEERLTKQFIFQYVAGINRLSYGAPYQEIDPEIVFKSSLIPTEIINADTIIDHMIGIVIKDPGEL